MRCLHHHSGLRRQFVWAIGGSPAKSGEIATPEETFLAQKFINPSHRVKLTMSKHRIFTTSFASVYPHYVAKAEKKGRTKAEVDEIIRWLTGYNQRQLNAIIKNKTDFETFFAEAPDLNPARNLIKGVVCGIRVEEIEEPTMREIRYLDKLVDELAKGKAMEKILRKPADA